MKTNLNLGILAVGLSVGLWGAGCGGTAEQANAEQTPNPMPDAESSAGAPSSSAGAPSSSAGGPNGTAGAPGDGGLLGRACPAVDIHSSADIRVKVAFSEETAKLGTFRVCRNDECYSAVQTGNGLQLTPDTQSGAFGIGLRFEGSADSPFLHLNWTFRDSDKEYLTPDTFMLEFTAAEATEPLTLIDQTVAYEEQNWPDFPHCGTWGTASVNASVK